VKSWTPTRLLAGEGRANREETDKHLSDPPACGSPPITQITFPAVLAQVTLPTSSIKKDDGQADVGQGRSTVG
jgi:hypothetical protein